MQPGQCFLQSPLFCSHHISAKQLTFAIYIILCQYFYPSFIQGSKYKTKFGEINILDCDFLLSSYGNESHKSVRFRKYTTLDMVLFLQLIGSKQKEVGASWAKSTEFFQYNMILFHDIKLCPNKTIKGREVPIHFNT